VQDLQKECRRRHVSPVVGHVKGDENPVVAPSRRLMGLAEYKLNADVFKALESEFSPFGLDACAASWNAQLPRYLSRQKGYRVALGHDVLSFPL